MADSSIKYPLTKMNFVVSIEGAGGGAFSEVTGMEATVDVIEFRQGNSNSLAPIKIPGLVKHGNVTLKYGYVTGTQLKEWIIKCVSDTRGEKIEKKNISIELIDISETAPTTVSETASAGGITWTLKNAWVTKYSAPDLNATTSEVAIESIELAYEELTVAK